jgi:nucleoside-diphosphate-sugar epimerase
MHTALRTRALDLVPTDSTVRPGTETVVAVTGASGYVGSLVVAGFLAGGYRVRRLGRRGPGPPDSADFSLDRVIPAASLERVDTLVHCAYDFTVTRRDEIWRANVLGTQRLFVAAAAAGVRRTIFISSMSAYAGTRQLYGRAKLACEAMALSQGMCVLRLGMVYGENPGGMAGALKKLASLPVIPLPGAGSHQFMLHEEDLSRALPMLAEADEWPDTAIGLAHPVAVPFRKVMARAARSAGKARPLFIPIPWRPLFWTMSLAERTPIRPPLRADSLLGLARPAAAVPLADYVRSLGIQLRSFPG